MGDENPIASEEGECHAPYDSLITMFSLLFLTSSCRMAPSKFLGTPFLVGFYLPLIRLQTAVPATTTNNSKNRAPAEGSRAHPITAKIPALRMVPRVLSNAIAVGPLATPYCPTFIPDPSL